MANAAPTLTGLATSVTFDENTVNATPQLIDSDISFSDADDNFDGGTLVVSGVLAEDTVSIRHQGNGAGQIGFSGGNITYGGTVIGTAAGGTGATLTVTFNASATSTAIDALIENLTYANSSDTPAASRTLSILVTDADGAHPVSPAVFAARTGGANPFNGIDIGLDSAPTFGDLDGDGDFDMALGVNDGDVRYFSNTGSATSPVFVQQNGDANPFNGLDAGDLSFPAFGDLDGDGDLDLAVGSVFDPIVYWMNTGSATAPAFARQTGSNDPFDAIDITLALPAFADLDGDGDLDLTIGLSDGALTYFENTGSASAPVFTARPDAANPFNGIDLGVSSEPELGDLDGDGDFDVIAGNGDGDLRYLENTGSTTAPAFAERTGASNPLNGKDMGIDSAAGLVDLDGDGDLDAVAGASSGILSYFENVASVFKLVVNVTAENDAPIARNDRQSTGEDTVLNASVPAAFDEDGTIASYAVDTDVAKGSLTFDPDGSYSFNPNGAFEALGVGDREHVTFTYHAVDNSGASSAVKTVTITVDGVNDAPVAVDDRQATDQDTVLNGSVPAATDVDGTIAQYAVDADVAKGSLTFNPDGTFSFDPNGAFEHLAGGETEAIRFAYHAIDNDGAASPIQTIIITVAGINDAPVARADHQSTGEDTVLNASVPAAFDEDGTIASYAVDADVAKGALVFNTDGSYSFDPNGAFEALDAGESELVTFAYHAVDNGGASSAVKTVTIRVTGVNDAPVAVDDRQATDQDTVLNGSVPAATDVDGTIAQYAVDTGVAKGILVFNADGTFSFDPNGAFEHLAGGETEAIRFAYHAIDNDGAASPIQTIIITVAGINDAPIARGDGQSTGEDTVLDASVPAAFDEDGTIASYAVDTHVAKGSLTFDADGSYSFNPDGAFEALDAGESEQVVFTYHAVDNGGVASAVKTVTITVDGVDDAPAITSGSAFAAKENTSAVGTINATDPDDTPVFSIAGGADGALFSINAATGALAFKATPDFENPADADGDNTYSVLVSASDGTTAGTQAITVTVTDEDGVTIKGGEKKDTVDEARTVKGQAMPTAEEDTITGSAATDRLSGLGGNDVLDGGRGEDRLFGGDGHDILIGGANGDILNGGGGSDRFVFGAELESTAENDGADFGLDTLMPMLRTLSSGMFGSDAEGIARNANVDKIIDFEAGVDTIALAHGVFSGLKVGELKSNAFVVGTEAKAGSHHVIYDDDRGRLLFDADGKGGKDALLFAKVGKGLDLDAGDFLVI